MAGLPAHIRAMAELSPVEDVLLVLLRQALPDVEVKTLIAAQQRFPLVLVRRAPHLGQWAGDTRFVDSADIVVHTFAADPDGDQDAAILAEAVRVALRDAWLHHRTAAGLGHVLRVDMTSAPRRATDWATATGPVQYADLPTGVWRYETAYRVTIRRPATPPFP